MATKRVPVTYAFGLRDRIDPKLAPLGVLKVGRNLRVRKDGRLGTRHGYQPLSMTTANGTLYAFDLHEHRGRLCALGTDAADSFPTDRFEYLGISPYAWRGSDRFGQRVTVNPFTALREVAGIPQPAGGVTSCDVAISGGYVCLAYVTAMVAMEKPFVIIVDAQTDQVIHAESLDADGGIAGPLADGLPSRMRVAAVGSTFYVGAVFANGALQVGQFTVGSSTRFTSYVSIPAGDPITAFDMVAVGNPSTARVALAYDRDAPESDLTITVHDAAGGLVTTATVEDTDTVFVALEADQFVGAINVFTVEDVDDAFLRTFNFSGALTAGPTEAGFGTSGSLCRLSAQGSLAESVAVALNKASNDVSLKLFPQVGHSVTPNDFTQVQGVLMRTRLLNAQSDGQPIAVVFGGIVAANLSAVEDATNAIFYVTPTTKQQAFRDYVRAADQPSPMTPFNLTRDANGLAWLTLADPGVDDIAIPIVSLLQFQSTARRQGAPFGDLYYEAGAAPAVYDGRFSSEIGFGESPGIANLQASNDPAYETVATLTGKPISRRLTTGGSLVFVVQVGAGTPDVTTVTIPFPPMFPVVVTTLIQSLSGGTLTASVVDNRIVVSTVASGAEVSLTLREGSLADDIGMDHLIGRTAYGSSALTPGGTYYYTVHYEYVLADRSVMYGPPSVGGRAGEGFERAAVVTLTGDQNVVQVSFTGPHTARAAMGDALYGADLTAVISRTVFDPVTGTAGSIFRRAVPARLFELFGQGYGQGYSYQDNVTDTDLADNEVIYTQGPRGLLSGPLEQNAPRACRFLTATESRLITGGLGRDSTVQVSREAFTGESISFSDVSPFFSQVAGPVTGVHRLDSNRLIFTRDRIYAVGGAGPDDLGGGGFDPPVELPTPSGLSNEWSFLEGPDGLWFQLDENKLFRIPRGGGSPTWEGIDVQDTLDLFPHIVGACKHRGDSVGVFAANSATDNNPILIVRDFRTEQWFVDEPPTQGEFIDAICAYGETLAYAADGAVFVQHASSFADVVSTFISTRATTHPLYPFGVNGYGQIYDLMLTGEYRGDCQLDCRISFDDGLNWTTLESFELAGLAVGETVQRRWAMPQDITSSIVVEFTITEVAGATEGFVFNQMDLLVEAEDGLRELTAEQMA